MHPSLRPENAVLLVEDLIHRPGSPVGAIVAVEVGADPSNTILVAASEIVRTETGTAIEIGTIIIIVEMAETKTERKIVTAGMAEETKIEMAGTENGANARALQVQVLPPHRSHYRTILLLTDQPRGCDIPLIAMSMNPWSVNMCGSRSKRKGRTTLTKMLTKKTTIKKTTTTMARKKNPMMITGSDIA
jgi:hypothetical protein